MKNIIVAAALAVSSLLAFAPASYADTVIIKTNDRPMHRHWHPRPQRCVVKTVKTWHHGHPVVKETRVCRR